MSHTHHEKFMRTAIELAHDGFTHNKGGPFGAVIVYDGKIVGRGCNKVTSTNDPTAHAEVVAIRDACHHLKTFSLKGAQIYTSCEPCPMCLAAIFWARLDAIWYAATRDDAAKIGFDDAFFYEEIAHTPQNRQIPSLPILRDESIKVFDKWSKFDTKIQY